MFDMSWGEVMVIGTVALIVIGPKDLPKALRTVGRMTAQMRRMAGEFQNQFNEAMREAELDEVRKEIHGINQSVSSATKTGFNPIQTVRDELKGAIEGSPTASGASIPAAAQAAPAPASTPPSDEAAVLPAPSVPPVLDPAHAFAVEPGAPPATPPLPGADKPDGPKA